MSVDTTVRVLMLPYEPVSFLINRAQCSSSVYISKTVTVPRELSYLGEELVSGELTMPLFDLDLFLRDLFHVEPSGAAHLALIRSYGSFPAPIQAKLAALGYDAGTPAAFRVASSTIMSELSMEQLSRFPATPAPFLEARGVLAVSIPDNEGFRCMIDLDLLFLNNILERYTGEEVEE